MTYNPNHKYYSISATEDHIKCPRRRWFKKTCKMPVQQSTPTVFGDIAHACCERFLKADDRGCDKNGRPVDLFPKGWMTMKPRFGKDETTYTISEEEGALIKTLITKAINEGYLIREPGRRVEKEFKHIIHKEGTKSIVLIGFIDLENPNEVLDHKFVKNMNYALSTKRNAKLAIVKSVQMMTYALTKYIEGHKGNLFLSLLYYVKDFDNPSIQRRSIEVTELEVKQFFVDTVLPAMRKMLSLDLKYPKHRVLEWRDIPGPDDPTNECNHHYGKPCPFMGVCYEVFTVNQYLATFGRDINEMLIEQSLNEGISTMNNLIAQCKKEVASMGQQAPVAAVTQPVAPAPEPAAANTGLSSIFNSQPAPIANPAPAPATQSAPPVMQPDTPAIPATPTQPVLSTQPTQPQQQRAPWYHDWNGQGCTACKDNPIQGYSTKRTPCVPCDARNQLNGLPTSAAYNVESNEHGVLTFTLKSEQSAVAPQATEVQAVAEPAVKTNTIFQPAPAPAPAEVVAAPAVDNKLESILTPVPATNPAPTAEPAPAPTTASTGYTLLLGCMPTRGHHHATPADDIMSSVMKDIEAASGKALNSLNHFDVLNAVEAAVADYIPQLKANGGTIFAYPTTKGSAMDRLVEGLRIHADTVISPIGL